MTTTITAARNPLPVFLACAAGLLVLPLAMQMLGVGEAWKRT